MICPYELASILMEEFELDENTARVKARIILQRIEDHQNAKLTYKRRQSLGSSSFAVPGKRKLPIHDCAHVRNAIARFSQTQGLTSEERKTAARKILRAAKRCGIDVDEGSAVYKAAH